MSEASSVKAQVSVTPGGSLYVGVEARQRLGLGYNDPVRVEFPDSEGFNAFTGFLTTANEFYIGRENARRLRSDDAIGSERLEAVVSRGGSLTWDDVNDLSESRWDAAGNRLRTR